MQRYELICHAELMKKSGMTKVKLRLAILSRAAREFFLSGVLVS